MENVDVIMKEAFHPYRMARSQEYRAGVRAALKFRLHSVKVVCPYPVGTAAADAFFAGLDEGHRVWREQTAITQRNAGKFETKAAA